MWQPCLCLCAGHLQFINVKDIDHCPAFQLAYLALEILDIGVSWNIPFKSIEVSFLYIILQENVCEWFTSRYTCCKVKSAYSTVALPCLECNPQGI